MKKIKSSLYSVSLMLPYVLLVVMLVSAPFFAFAQNTTDTPGAPGNNTTDTPGASQTPSNPSLQNITIANPFKGGSDLASIITTVLQNIVDPIAAVFVVLAIIYAGFQYITAQGNPKAIGEANQTLLYVLIGTMVLLGATGISAAIKGTVCPALINC